MAPLNRLRRVAILACVGSGACALLAQSDPPPVTAKVEIVHPQAGKKLPVAKTGADASNVVIWLTSLNSSMGANSAPPPARPMPQIVQSNKSFNPHVVAIQTGGVVQFPNMDPFLHNVFSLFDGKRFDLGFYEAGSSKTVKFDRTGVSFLFCNIHPEMSAAVVAVDTPYFGISDRSGRVVVADVPSGRYQLNVWYERSMPEDLKSAGRVVTISDAARSLDPIRVVENPNFSPEHKNKYGQDYIPPASSTPAYGHP